MYDIEKCDILNEKGKLYLVYDYEDYGDQPVILWAAHSYESMNNFALDFFGKKKWAAYMIKMSGEYNDYTVDSLVEDLYQNHHDLYVEALAALSHKHAEPDGIKLMSNNRIDENGDRVAKFTVESLEALDIWTLKVLADGFGIEDFNFMDRDELIEAINETEFGVDDDGECVECDCDCENCGYKDINDDVEIPDMHDTGKLDAKGRKIFEYDRDELEDLSVNTLCDMANDLLIDLDTITYKEDLINKICDVAALVAPKHEDWPHEIVSKLEVENDSKNIMPLDSTAPDENVPQNEAQEYESVNGPAHYNGTECIENMRKLFGDEAVRWFCICNAYKYRFRKGNKPGQSAATDENKAHWYEDYAAKMMSEQRYY